MSTAADEIEQLQVVVAKWFLDRALRDGFGSVDAVVLTEGGCCASFDIQKTVWNCSIPGGELTVIVKPEMLGGNCCEWSHIHANDHRVADLVDELEAREVCKPPVEDGPASCVECRGPLVDYEFGSLCGSCAEDASIPF